MNMRYRGLAIVAVLSIILAVACAASVDDGADAAKDDVINFDKVCYKVTSETPKEVEVTSPVGSAYTGTIVVKADVNGYAVVSISDSAFKGCKEVTSVTLPTSLKTIGNNAFEGCSNITTVTVPDGVTSIGDMAFKDCVKVSKITISKTVETIGTDAFRGCTALSEFVVAADNDDFCSEDKVLLNKLKTEILCYPAAKDGEYSIPTGVSTIPKYAFEGSKIGKVIIPNTVLSIEEGAFSKCSNLTAIIVTVGNLNYSSDVYGVLYKGTELLQCPGGYSQGTHTIRSGTTAISASAYKGCAGLTSIVIGSGMLETVGEGAFDGCTKLKSVSMSDTATDARIIIGNYSFRDCTSLASVSMGVPSNALKAIGEYAFSGCKSLVSISMGNSSSDAQTIGQYAFSGCKSLESISMGDSADNAQITIGDHAFDGCDKLASVSMNGLADDAQITIGESAFNGCTKLVAMNLSKAKSIGEGAFKGCTSLRLADLSKIVEISKSSFEGCTSLATVKLTNSAIDIKDFAFRGCKFLTMQDSVTCCTNSIGVSAFEGCASLNFIKIKISGNVSIEASAFKGCGSLQYVEITGADGMTAEVKENAFEDCSQMVSFSFEKVSKVGESAFEGCSRLQKATLSVATQLGSDSFKGCGSLTTLDMRSVIAVPNGCFEGCGSLKTVNWRGAVSIGDSAFSGCASLTSIPPSPTSLGNDSFKGCISLGIVSLGSASELTSVGDGAFSGCTSITSVKFNDRVTVIGNEVFSGCTSLATVTAGGVVTVGDGAFDGCSKLTTYLPSATAIGGDAYRCTALSEIDMGKTVSVGPGAFEDCTKLKTIKISDNVEITRIPEDAFKGCTAIKEITIPASVASIGSNAFKGCTSLSKVTFNHASDPLPAMDVDTSFDCGTSSNPVSLTFIVEEGTSSNFLPVNTDYTTVTLGGSSTFTMFYNANGGTGTAQGTSVPSNGTVHPYASGISRSGYRLMGWSTTPGGAVVESIQNVTANITVYAVWEKEYTITYDKNGGTGTTESEKIIAHKVYYLKESTAYIKANFIFLGWATTKGATETTDHVITPAKDMSVYAVWGAAVKITYDKNGGAGEAYSDSTLKGNPYTLPIGCRYTNDGYTFGGWSKTADGKSPISKVDGTADITVFATWMDMSYKITYKANGGAGTHAADTVTKGASFTLDTIPEFTKDGYYFVGWSDSSSGKTIIKTLEKVTSDQTVYAIWTDTQFTVTYNANGGTGTHAADKVAKGGSITLDTTTSFKRSGYGFSGWSLTPTGAAVKTLEGVSADTTVYAIWKIIYTVSFDANGGTGTQSPIRATEGSMSQLYGSTTFVGPSGKEFKGWSRTADSTDTVASVLMSDNITMYAVWGASTSSDNPDVGDDPSTSSEGGWQVPVMVAVPLALLGVTAGLIWYRTGRI